MEYTEYLALQERMAKWEEKWEKQEQERIAKKLLQNPNWKPKKKKRNPEYNTYNEYRNTTNSSVFRKLHKRIHAFDDWDKWHGPFGSWDNDPWIWPYCDINKPNKRGRNVVVVNWKMVSKNRKQWMEKPFIFDAACTRWGLNANVKVTWPYKIRPK
jgi:hypothetical protein